jgi:hypothetical protein
MQRRAKALEHLPGPKPKYWLPGFMALIVRKDPHRYSTVLAERFGPIFKFRVLCFHVSGPRPCHQHDMGFMSITGLRSSIVHFAGGGRPCPERVHFLDSAQFSSHRCRMLVQRGHLNKHAPCAGGLHHRSCSGNSRPAQQARRQAALPVLLPGPGKTLSTHSLPAFTSFICPTHLHGGCAPSCEMQGMSSASFCSASQDNPHGWCQTKVRKLLIEAPWGCFRRHMPRGRIDVSKVMRSKCAFLNKSPGCCSSWGAPTC